MKGYIFLFITLQVMPIFAQERGKFSGGVYGRCEHPNQCFQIKFNPDQTFSYYVNRFIEGKGIVNGAWEILSDTILLSIDIPVRKPFITKSDSQGNSTRIFFLTGYKDTIPLSETFIFINQKNRYTTDLSGSIVVKECDLPINRIDIQHMFIGLRYS